MIRKLVIGAVGEGVVFSGLGAMDGQMEEPVCLRRLLLFTLAATQDETDAPEAPQGFLR